MAHEPECLYFESIFKERSEEKNIHRPEKKEHLYSFHNNLDTDDRLYKVSTKKKYYNIDYKIYNLKNYIKEFDETHNFYENLFEHDMLPVNDLQKPPTSGPIDIRQFGLIEPGDVSYVFDSSNASDLVRGPCLTDLLRFYYQALETTQLSEKSRGDKITRAKRAEVVLHNGLNEDMLRKIFERLDPQIRKRHEKNLDRDALTDAAFEDLLLALQSQPFGDTRKVAKAFGYSLSFRPQFLKKTERYNVRLSRNADEIYSVARNVGSCLTTDGIACQKDTGVFYLIVERDNKPLGYARALVLVDESKTPILGIDTIEIPRKRAGAYLNKEDVERNKDIIEAAMMGAIRLGLDMNADKVVATRRQSGVRDIVGEGFKTQDGNLSRVGENGTSFTFGKYRQECQVEVLFENWRRRANEYLDSRNLTSSESEKSMIEVSQAS